MRVESGRHDSSRPPSRSSSSSLSTLNPQLSTSSPCTSSSTSTARFSIPDPASSPASSTPCGKRPDRPGGGRSVVVHRPAAPGDLQKARRSGRARTFSSPPSGNTASVTARSGSLNASSIRKSKAFWPNFRALGHTLHVATSKAEIYAKRIIEHFGLDRYFASVNGSELDGTRANKAELIAHILKRENIAALGRHHDRRPRTRHDRSQS